MNLFKSRAFSIILIILMLVAFIVLSSFLMLNMKSRYQTPSQIPSDEPFVSTPSDEPAIAVSTVSEIIDQTSITEETSQTEQTHGWVINNMGYTYIYEGIGLEQFNSSNSTLKRYADGIKSIKALLSDKTKTYCMIVPTQAAFIEIPRDVYKADNFYNSSQSSFISTLERELGEDIETVDIYKSFAEKYDSGEYLYFNTDRNWTADAAFCAYNEFSAKAGLTPISLSSCVKREYSGFLGSFYTASRSSALLKNPDTINYYYTDAQIKATVTLYDGGNVYKSFSLVGNSISDNTTAYDVFLGRMGERFVITTTANSEKTLLIIGDSSVSPFIPFLISHYKEIQYINPLYSKSDVKEFLQNNSFDEALFMCYATNAVKGDYAPAFAEIVQQKEESVWTTQSSSEVSSR